MEISKLHQIFLKSTGVATDTRKITSGNIFFALKGDNFDANTFAEQALQLGAYIVVIDDSANFINSQKTILVDDVLETLQELAKFHRKSLNIQIVAITGSNGKTTTKELFNAVVGPSKSTKATVGNLNNHIGVPLTLLSFDESTEIGIVEMGANHQKEIAFLCDLACPDYGYVTNFGKAHLEGFGGIEGVIKGKSEMYDYFADHDCMALVNLNDSIQVEKTTNLKTIGFTTSKTVAFLNIDSIEANPLLKINFNGIVVQSNLIGIYNASNIAAAILFGKYNGVSDVDIKKRIENYVPQNNRSQLIQKNGNEIILDAYNANPTSMKAALDNFCQLDKLSKIAILGDMFELGDESITEHKAIVDSLQSKINIKCFFVGTHFFACSIDMPHFAFFEDFESLSKIILTMKIQNSSILIKGSRGMALERTLDFI